MPRSSCSERNVHLIDSYLAEPFADSVAAYVWLDADDDGNVWAMQHRLPLYPPDSTRYHVFSRTGAFLGEVRVPTRLQLEHIGDDFVLGIERDSLDVERVRLYDLIKPAGG